MIVHFLTGFQFVVRWCPLFPSLEIFQLVENLGLVLVLGILMLAPLGNESALRSGFPTGITRARVGARVVKVFVCATAPRQSTELSILTPILFFVIPFAMLCLDWLDLISIYFCHGKMQQVFASVPFSVSYGKNTYLPAWAVPSFMSWNPDRGFLSTSDTPRQSAGVSRISCALRLPWRS